MVLHSAHAIARGLALLAAALLVAVALYTCADAIVRKFGTTALPGAVDVVGYGLGMVIALGLPYCTLQLGHVSVPVFVDKIPGRAGAAIRQLAPLLSTLFFMLIAWRIGLIALKRRQGGDQMWMLAIETWPIWIAVTALLCVTAIAQGMVLALPEQATVKPEDDIADAEEGAV